MFSTFKLGLLALLVSVTGWSQLRLAEALEAPEYHREGWSQAFRERAGALGPAARPALRAVMADEDRAPEEHVAADQLAAAIDRDG